MDCMTKFELFKVWRDIQEMGMFDDLVDSCVYFPDDAVEEFTIMRKNAIQVYIPSVI